MRDATPTFPDTCETALVSTSAQLCHQRSRDELATPSQDCSVWQRDYIHDRSEGFSRTRITKSSSEGDLFLSARSSFFLFSFFLFSFFSFFFLFLLSFLSARYVGHPKVIIQGDSEHALMAVIHDACALLTAATPRTSPCEQQGLKWSSRESSTIR